MFENQLPQVKTGVVANGETVSETIVLAAAVAGAKNRVLVGHVSLGAAGSFVIKDGATPVSMVYQLQAKGTIYVGEVFETAVNSALNLVATLDYASVGATPVQASVKSDTK